MTKSGKSLPKDVVKHWPEVFEDIKLNALPLRYLTSVLVNFKDGKTWEIKITPQTRKEGWTTFEENLSELISEYDDAVDNVDFKLDTERVKKDIEKTTQKFLKKKKL
jgi:hypothetical protein